MRRILMILPQEFMAYHGSGIQVRNRLRAMLESGDCQVDLLTLPYGAPLELAGLLINRLPCLPFCGDAIRIGPSGKKILYDWLLLAAALARVAWCSYDIIYTHEEAGLIGAIIRRVAKVRHIYEMHSFLPEGMCNYGACDKGSWLWRLALVMQKVILKSADQVVAISPQIATNSHELVKGAKVTTIENSFPEGETRPGPLIVEACQRDYNPDHRPVVMYTGNMSEFQGVDLLLEAISHVRQQVADVLFLFVGLGAAEVAYGEDWVARRGLSKSARFVPRVAVEMIPALLHVASCLVSPRKTGSNTPLKLYAYMAAGKPIVATRIAAHQTALGEAEAFMVECNGEAIAGGIVRALIDADAAAERSAKALALYEKRFSWRIFAAAVQALINATMEEG